MSANNNQSVIFRIVVAALVAAAGVFGLRAYNAYKAPPPPPPPVAAPAPVVLPTRTIVIASRPSGATIWVDNINTGLITPTPLEVPADGKFVMMLHKAGYKPFVSNQVLQGLRGSKFEATLGRPGRASSKRH